MDLILKKTGETTVEETPPKIVHEEAVLLADKRRLERKINRHQIELDKVNTILEKLKE